MGELFKSGMNVLNEVFQEIFDNMAIRKGEEAKGPADIAKEFPIEIVPYEHIFDVLNEAIQKRAYGHFGCYFRCEPSNMFRDSRITRPKILSDFRQIVCLRGEVYELMKKGNNREWRERKVYLDINDKWHLWDGSYNIWVDLEGVLTNNPSKPTKIYKSI